MSERKLNGLFHLLLLHIHPADVRVAHVRLLIRLNLGAISNYICVDQVWLQRIFYLQHRNGAVCLRGQHVHECIGVLVQRNRRRRLQQLAIEGGEDAHVVIGPSGRADDSGVLKIILIILRYICRLIRKE